MLQAVSPFTPEGFRVKTKIRQQWANRQRRIARRLDKTDVPNCQRPIFTASDIHYEIAGRTRGISSGGIGALHALARHVGLIGARGPGGDDRRHPRPGEVSLAHHSLLFLDELS